MSYQWTSAATPQGRERLKELADSGTDVFVKCKGREGMFYNVLATMPNPFGREEKYSLLMRLNNVSKPFDWYIENGIEFLDPSLTQPKDDAHLDLMRYILTLSDDVSASYIKGMIHENLSKI